MLSEKEFNYLKMYIAYNDLAADIRGRLLNQCINLERIIDNFLAAHFCDNNNKRLQMLALLLNNGNVGLKSKLITTHTIITEVLKQEIGEVVFDINKILGLRNAVAHRSLYENGIIESINEQKIILKEYHGKPKEVEIKKEDLHRIIDEIETLQFFIMRLTNAPTPS